MSMARHPNPVKMSEHILQHEFAIKDVPQCLGAEQLLSELAREKFGFPRAAEQLGDPSASAKGNEISRDPVTLSLINPVYVLAHQKDGISVGGESFSSPSRALPSMLSPVRKFYYITLLRDPVSRYLSEWRHVQRGATWKTSLHMCDGRTPTPEELPSCYEGTDWSGCTLQEFMDCPYNLANNRQVRMLADLSLVGCYNMSFIPENKRAQILLESAKKNLKDMAFFGLTEFQRKTQYLFERTFNLKFIRPFMQYNSTRAGGVEVDNDTIRRIEELNDLDMQLYDYAKDLFQQRYQYKRQLERMEQRRKNREERLLHRSNEALPKEETEEQGRLPTEDYMSHIIEKW
ncbi:hypothetical protein DV515_00014061 [Chloebia gouldiae]|uniref:Heparan-sulfate 6-O-sulfotransferase n=1 Tax=Chloebia gouldiae TaxID=44316 RepID=A0A3L8S0L3_CHLGU|nr:hypothetical protein DV515_00014061 [Chloebia gouldiae]